MEFEEYCKDCIVAARYEDLKKAFAEADFDQIVSMCCGSCPKRFDLKSIK